MATKKKILLSFVVIFVLIYLFSIRNIELFNFKDEKITRSDISYISGEDNPKTYTFDKDKTIDDFINRIKEEDFRSSLQIRNKDEALSVNSDKSITIRIYTTTNNKNYYYIFEIFGNGVISYKKHEEDPDAESTDKVLKIGLWNNEKAQNLYKDLEDMILGD